MNVIESRIVGSRPSPAATQVRLSLGLPDSNTPGYGLIRLGVCSKMSSKLPNTPTEPKEHQEDDNGKDKS